jgi:small subunit ribosomal protein S8
MIMTDPVADMLTRIRNGLTAKHKVVEVPKSNLKKDIAEILVKEGYIEDLEVHDDGLQGVIKLTLKYSGKGEKAIQGIKKISKPGLRVYSNYEKLPKVLNGLGIAIISTSKGVMTDKAARAAKIGGEVLAFVW